MVARPPPHHLAFPSPSLSPKALLAALPASFIGSSYPLSRAGLFPLAIPTRYSHSGLCQSDPSASPITTGAVDPTQQDLVHDLLSLLFLDVPIQEGLEGGEVQQRAHRPYHAIVGSDRTEGFTHEPFYRGSYMSFPLLDHGQLPLLEVSLDVR